MSDIDVHRDGFSGRRVRYERYFGNQTGWVEPNNDAVTDSVIRAPRPPLRARLIGYKTYRVDLRLEPVPEIDLYEFGQQIGEIIGVDPGKVQPGHKAIFMSGWSYGWASKLAAVMFADWFSDLASGALANKMIAGGGIRVIRQ